MLEEFKIKYTLFLKLNRVSFIYYSIVFIYFKSVFQNKTSFHTNIHKYSEWSQTIPYHQRFRFQLNRFQTYKFKWFSLLRVTYKFTMFNINNNGLYIITNICFDHRFHLSLY